MRLLQNVLLVVGATALGVAVLGLALPFVAAIIFLRPRPGQDPSLNFGAGALAEICMGCGGLFGGIIGFACSLHWIARHGRKSWGPIVWAGAGLGFVGGATASVVELGRRFECEFIPGIAGSWECWLPAGLLSLAAGTLGGIAAGIGQKLFRSAKT